MNDMEQRAQVPQRLWVGLDWGKKKHSVCVVDDEQNIVAVCTIDGTLKELRGFVAWLRDLGPVAGIAIESTPNPVLPFLFAEGFTIYPVNPKLSKNWREGNSVAGVKSDARDGKVLAIELARRYRQLRILQEAPHKVSDLAGLCQGISKLVDQRTALVLRLESTLLAYYPAALEFFSDWTSPVAWRFVKRFSTPRKLAHSRKDTLIRFLKANRVGIKPLWLERIERRTEAADWPQPWNNLALELSALAAVAELLALQPRIAHCEKLIAGCVKELPQASLLRSLPGAGDRLAPALTAITALVTEEDESLQALRCLSGVAPIQHESGRRKPSKFRRRCNKHWRCVLHKFANCSKQHCPWAKAFYDLCRERGDGHATALRKLADKWLKIIHRMLETGEPYDNGRYVEALRRGGSPVYQKLCEQTCG